MGFVTLDDVFEVIRRGGVYREEFLDRPQYKLKPSAEAVKLGVNIALYSMTH